MKRLSLRPVPVHKSPREEAADWLLLEERAPLTPDDAARLEAWLAVLENREAYEAVAGVYRLADEHAAAHGIMDLRRAALADRPQARPLALTAASAAALVLAVGVGWSSLPATPSKAPSPIARISELVGARTNPASAVYRTRVGERLTFTLPDGSVATLNTNSVLKVAYADTERGVRLVQGQALFEVAKHKQRPFRVYAGDRRITAMGTVFDVRLDGDKVKVALVEGVVRVTPAKPTGPAAAPAQQVDLAPGEVLEADRAAPMLVTTADARRAISWKSGIVEFSGESLGVAVGEMNRYSHQPIQIADPAIAGYRVSGVFRTGEPELFARMMSQVLPITVEEGRGGALTLKTRPPEEKHAAR